MNKKPTILDIAEHMTNKGMARLRDAAQKRVSRFMRLAQDTTNEKRQQHYLGLANQAAVLAADAEERMRTAMEKLRAKKPRTSVRQPD